MRCCTCALRANASAFADCAAHLHIQGLCKPMLLNFTFALPRNPSGLVVRCLLAIRVLVRLRHFVYLHASTVQNSSFRVGCPSVDWRRCQFLVGRWGFRELVMLVGSIAHPICPPRQPRCSHVEEECVSKVDCPDDSCGLKEQTASRSSRRLSGSLLDTALDFCYNRNRIRIKNDHFSYGPNRKQRVECDGNARLIAEIEVLHHFLHGPNSEGS